MHKPSLLIALLTLAGLLQLTGCPKPAEVADPRGGSASATKPGWTGDAIDFQFTTHDGKTSKLSDYAGQPLVLNFWADWCPPCVAEFPEFQEAYSASGGKYALVSITDSSSKDPKGFVSSKGYDWVFGISDEGPRLYSLEGWPTTLFIDSAGNIKEKQLGGIDRAGFEAKVASII